MADGYIWGNLVRANNDDTLIDQAIDEAITAHNDDVEAHLGPDQSLQSHRASEIIDHVAESVVNDKIRSQARAYVAIVDPTTDGDFDTIQGAIDYATTVGGGTIMVRPGTHYLSGEIEVPTSINLKGLDPDTTTIVGGDTATGSLKFYSDDPSGIETCYIEGLKFTTTGGYIIRVNDASEITYNGLRIRDCVFAGGGNYIDAEPNGIIFEDCDFYCSTTYAVACGGLVTMRNCRALPHGSTGGRLFLSSSIFYGNTNQYNFENCTFAGNTGWNSLYLDISTAEEFYAMNSTFFGVGVLNFTNASPRIHNSTIWLTASGYINIPNGYAKMIGNTVLNGTGGKVRMPSGSNYNIICCNRIVGSITNSGTGNAVANNVSA